MLAEDRQHKPPLGVKPRRLHDMDRLCDLFNAMIRYLANDMKIPEEWCIEINDILWNFVE